MPTKIALIGFILSSYTYAYLSIYIWTHVSSFSYFLYIFLNFPTIFDFFDIFFDISKVIRWTFSWQVGFSFPHSIYWDLNGCENESD